MSASDETDPAQDPGQPTDADAGAGAEQASDAVADPDPTADPAGSAEEAAPAAAIGSIHPRLEMHGPHAGPTAGRRLPVLGSVPYAGPTEPGWGRSSRLVPVLAVVAAGGLAATGAVVWSSDDAKTTPTTEQASPGAGATTTQSVPRDPTTTRAPSTSAAPTTSAAPSPSTAPPTSAAPDPSPAPAPAPAPTPSNIALMEPAAWFSGGRMVLVGALPDRGTADAFRRKAAEIVGDDAVVDQFTIDPGAPTPAGLPVAVAEQVRFDLNSSEVSAAQVALVKAWKEILDANPGVKMHITGFTDSTGPMAYNLELSLQRAQAVAGWMQARGVPADRFAVDGRGPADPVADNATDAGRANNRRIQVTLEGLLVV